MGPYQQTIATAKVCRLYRRHPVETNEFRMVAAARNIDPDSLLTDAMRLRMLPAEPDHHVVNFRLGKSGHSHLGDYSIGRFSELADNYAGYRGKVKSNFRRKLGDFLAQIAEQAKSENRPADLFFEANDDGEARLNATGAENPLEIEVVAHGGKKRRGEDGRKAPKSDRQAVARRHEQRRLEGRKNWKTGDEGVYVSSTAGDDQIIRDFRKKLKRHSFDRHVAVIAEELEEGRIFHFVVITSSDVKGALRHLDPRCKDQSVLSESDIDVSAGYVDIKHTALTDTRLGRLAVLAIIQEQWAWGCMSYRLPGNAQFSQKKETLSFGAALVSKWKVSKPATDQPAASETMDDQLQDAAASAEPQAPPSDALPEQAPMVNVAPATEASGDAEPPAEPALADEAQTSA